MAYKYKLVKENLPGAEDIDSFIDTFTLDPIKELGFPNGLSLRKLVDDYAKGLLSPQESKDAEMIIQITLELNNFADDDVDNYLDNLNDQRVTSLNEGEDPLQSYLTALLADLKNEQSPEEKAQDAKNARKGNTFKDMEVEGRKNLALEVISRLKNR
jgi:DNA-binding MltR family transcriptional regulator